MGVSLGCAIYANRDNILRFLRLEVPFGLVNVHSVLPRGHRVHLGADNTVC